MSESPNPLTPADCDLRGAAVPIDMLVDLMVSTFGFSAAHAEKMAREFAAEQSIPLTAAGHA